MLRSYLNLFIRDDLLSWNSAKSLYTTNQRALEAQLREKVDANVHTIIQRVRQMITSGHTHSEKVPHPPARVLLSDCTGSL